MTTTHVEQPPPVPSGQPTTHDGAVIGPVLIGICGYAGTGKDTAAAYLVENYGYRRIAFADRLRELAVAQNPTVRDEWGSTDTLQYFVRHRGWDRAKRELPDVRKLLQAIGQSHREVFGDNFWIDQVLPYPNQIAPPWPPLAPRTVITDVRYPNEATRIRDLGGIVVRVARAGVGPINDHVSEHQQIEADHTVTNITGEPDVLRLALDYLMEAAA